jgi:hypothetical protein
MNLSERAMRSRYRVALALLLALIAAVTQISPCLGQPDRPRPPPWGWDFTPEDWERLRVLVPLYLTVKAIVSTITSVLLLVIVAMQIDIYRRTGAKFSLGLVLFSTSLLLYTIFANPFLHSLLGFTRIGFGPMLIIPDVLTLIASAILIYLSRQ